MKKTILLTLCIIILSSPVFAWNSSCSTNPNDYEFFDRYDDSSINNIYYNWTGDMDVDEEQGRLRFTPIASWKCAQAWKYNPFSTNFTLEAQFLTNLTLNSAYLTIGLCDNSTAIDGCVVTAAPPDNRTSIRILNSDFGSRAYKEGVMNTKESIYTISSNTNYTLQLQKINETNLTYSIFNSNKSIRYGTYSEVLTSIPTDKSTMYLTICVYNDYGTQVYYLDDLIIYQGTTCPIAQETNPSRLINNGPTNASIYLLMKVQYFNTTILNWADEAVIINDTSPRAIKAGETLSLDAIWNPNAWNTSTNKHGPGTYRIYAAATDENDIILKNYNGINITAIHNFTLQYTPTGDTFKIKQGSTSIVIFDSAGNLFLKKTLTQSTTPTDTSDDEFLLKDDSGVVVAKINSTGYMQIKGTLKQNQGSLTNPAGDDFLIKDGNNVVARINESGYMFLKGSLYENSIS